MDTLKILFIILIIIFPLNQLARLQVRSEVVITAIDVVVGLTIVIWIVRAFGRKSLHRYILSRPIFIFVAVCFISLAVNSVWLKGNELVTSSFYLLRWLTYACLYFVVKDFNASFKKNVVFLLVFIGAIIVVGGYLQYFLYPDLRNLYYLGWDEHLYRMFSSFLDPNFAGAFFVLYLIFLAGLFKYQLDKRKKLAILIGFVSLFTLLAIYLTYSRSALVMLFVSFIVFLVFIKKVKWMIGLIIISALFILLASGNFYIESMNLFRTASVEARLDSGRNALQIIKDNMLIGVGFNAYRYAQVRYKFIDEENNPKNHAAAGTDNSFLFILATTGLIGLVSYSYLLFSILKRAYINYRATKKGEIISILPIIVIASFVGLIIDSLFINSLFYPSIMLWMWVLTGLTEST